MPETKVRNDEVYEDVEDIEGDEGQWVVIHQGKTVKAGESSDDAYRYAQSLHSDKVIVTKILYAGACYY
jgi:hypothetical protein